MSAAKGAHEGASLLPKDHAGGFLIPDGNYLIEEVYTTTFDYQGAVPDGVPAIMVSYRSEDGQLYEQPYKAGDNEHLQPSDDNKRFVHPRGEKAAIYKDGAASQWLRSILTNGFPAEKYEAQLAQGDVSVFKGTRVALTSVAAPKGKTADKDAAQKLIPIVSKVLAAPGAKATPGTGPKPSVAAAPRPAPPKAPAEAPATPSNGDADTQAVALIQAILGASDKALVRSELAGLVMKRSFADTSLRPNAKALRDRAADASWLVANADVGGWVTDGEEIAGS